MKQLLLFETKPTLWQRLVARLLVRANQKPPYSAKYEFYQIKDRLMQRYGTLDGCDLQEITYWCHSCDGTGGLYEPGGCYRCGGTGVYAKKWVWLQRWQWCGYTFHKPIDAVSWWDQEKTGYRNLIKGYVYHKANWRLSAEAVLWLALIYDRQLFRRLIVHLWEPRAWFPPLLLLRKLATFPILARAKWTRWRVERWARRELASKEIPEEVPF